MKERGEKGGKKLRGKKERRERNNQETETCGKSQFSARGALCHRV